MLLVATGEAMVGKRQVMGTTSAKREWSTGYKRFGGPARCCDFAGWTDAMRWLMWTIDRRDR